MDQVEAGVRKSLAAFPPAVALEARLLVIVGTEFVTEE
jgi:hypothetical protein